MALLPSRCSGGAVLRSLVAGGLAALLAGAAPGLALAAPAFPHGGIAATVAAVGQLSIPSQEQQAPQGRNVEQVRIEGNQRVPADTIRLFLSTREGAPFDWETARQDYRTLLNSGFFDNLVMRWEPGTAGGIVVVIEVVERPLLRRVRIEGTEKVDHDAFIERMETLEMPIVEDKEIDRERLRRGRDVLETMLQGEEGLQFVQIDLEIVESLQGAGVDAVYNVVEGDEVRIQNVTFEGATVFSQRELRWMMKRTGEHWLFSFLTKNDRFSWAGFENDMFQLRNRYTSLGYLDFQWGEPQIEVYEVGRPLFLDEKQRLFVTVPVAEGPQYRLGEVRFEGNERFSSEELMRLVPLQTGDIADVQQILQARDAMQAIYGNVGHMEVFISPIPDKNPETGIADLTYRIYENDVYYVNRIDFVGNTNTRDYVLRRNLRLHEKDRWNGARFQQSLFKIYQLGYFENIEPELQVVEQGGQRRVFDPEDDQARADYAMRQEEGEQQEGAEDGGTGMVDVKLKISEVGRNQVSFGGGVSALEGGFVQFGYTTRNLFGRGQTLSFFGQFGGRRTNARISYLEPYLFGKPMRFGFDLFRDALDFFDFQREGTGMSTRVGFPLDSNEFLTAFAEYNYEFIDIGNIGSSFFNINSPLFAALFFEEGQRTTSSFRPFLVWNDVDNPYNPSRGRRITSSFEYAGGPLGGSLDFWKAQLINTWYIPTVVQGRGVSARVSQILAINTELRWGGTHGDLDELPIFERFFLGGSNSVRGTRLRAVGPIDDFGNILGGDKALQYNVEYILQLADPLRLAFFHDAGQAWGPGDSIDLTDMRKTAGVEFKVFMPVFNVPFRFFWAYNFDPRTQFGEERSTFEFAIGSTF